MRKAQSHIHVLPVHTVLYIQVNRTQVLHSHEVCQTRVKMYAYLCFSGSFFLFIVPYPFKEHTNGG